MRWCSRLRCTTAVVLAGHYEGLNADPEYRKALDGFNTEASAGWGYYAPRRRHLSEAAAPDGWCSALGWRDPRVDLDFEKHRSL